MKPYLTKFVLIQVSSLQQPFSLAVSPNVPHGLLKPGYLVQGPNALPNVQVSKQETFFALSETRQSMTNTVRLSFDRGQRKNAEIDVVRAFGRLASGQSATCPV